MKNRTILQKRVKYVTLEHIINAKAMKKKLKILAYDTISILKVVQSKPKISYNPSPKPRYKTIKNVILAEIWIFLKK